MQKMCFRFLILSFSLLSISCTKVGRFTAFLDAQLFWHLGYVLFSSPTEFVITELKEDKGLIAGQEVLISGDLKEIGPNGTYLVLLDSTNSSEILVGLTGYDFSKIGTLRQNRPLKVWGVVENGKQGWPYVQAKGLNF